MAPSGGIDGDPHAELEALLAAMSGGVVGIGDRIGRTDVDVVARVCRSDGRLVGPDDAITLTDRSFATAGVDGNSLCWASASSGEWVYLVAINTAAEAQHITDSFDLAELGIGPEALVYDWRNRTAQPAASIDVDLDSRDWALFVCCPMSTDAAGHRSAVVGDPRRYATMGRSQVDHERLEIVAVDGEVGSLLRWSELNGLHH
ncbi:MAG: hypothetical protein R2710_06885 [Acidimicrobiales bacterium]